MKLIVDANVLFAALIKDSKTAELIFSNKLKLYAPEFLFKECEKHSLEIERKLQRKNFGEVLEMLKARIKIISRDQFKTLLKKAHKICPDSNDVVYFALALYLNCDIWSNDKKLKNQNDIRIYNTHELCQILDT